ncbi:MAG: MFS transporter [Candidatus Altiarchaeota archaeon]
MKANILFFLSTTATSMSIIFIPVIAQEMGASNLMIGAIVSIYGLMSLMSMYLFGWVSDKKGRVALIRAGMMLSCLTFILQAYANSEGSLFLARALCGFAIGVFYSSLIMYGVESGKKLGKFTSYESLGWGLGNLIAGIIAVYFRIFLLSSLFFFISFLLALRLPAVKHNVVKGPLIPFGIVRRNLNIYLPMLLRDIGAFCTWTFFPLYLIWLGADNLWIGILYFINTGGQFVLKQYVDRYDINRLFTWGLALSALGFYSYTLPENYLQVIPVQVLIAIAWTTLSVGAMGILTKANDEKATVIGLFSSTRGLAQIIAPLIGGIVMEYYGFNELMMFSGTITLFGLLVHFLIRRRE